jgi:hypothetical protein
MMGKTGTSVGLAWYRREDWKTLCDLFPDRSALHTTYDEWEADAKRIERQLGAQGLAVEHVIIDPAEFSGWCAVRGLVPDGAARSRFTTEAVRARHKTAYS